MKNNSYFLVQGWMINELNLKGNELLVFAIIFGFSKDNQSKFEGSLKYLSKSTGASRSTVLKTLSSLLEKELIVKENLIVNNITFCKYSQNEPVVLKLYGGGTEIVLGGGTKITPNNITTNNINNNKILLIERESKFKNSVLSFKEIYSKETLESFYNYWTEKNSKGTKMKFEMQLTFEVSKRLITWSKNSEKFNKEKSFAKKESEPIFAGRQTLSTIKANMDGSTIYNPYLKTKEE